MRYVILLCLMIAGSVRAQQPGDLDSSFAVNGKLVLEEYGPVRDIAFQSDGKIIVLTRIGEAFITKVIRLQEDGQIDTSFGINGQFEWSCIGKRIVILSTQDVLIFGQCSTNGQIIKLDPNGSLDPSFVHISNTIFDEADTYPDGKIVMGGPHPGGMMRLYRWQRHGELRGLRQ